MPDYSPDALALRFQAISGEFLSYIESIDDSQWSTKTDREGWPIGVAAHHVAVGAQFCSDLAVHVAGGGELTWTNEFVNSANQTHADFFQQIGKEEVVEALKEQFPLALEKIQALPADELGRDLGQTYDFGEGPVRYAGDIVERMIIAHVLDHLESIKEAISDS